MNSATPARHIGKSPNMIDRTGQRFGRLLVTAMSERRTPQGWAICVCLCDCGATKEVSAHNLVNGHVRSCCCLVRETRGDNNRTHGKSKTRTYQSWARMKARCYNPNHDKYEYWGGRGITVCERWLNSFENFLADIGEKPIGLTLERTDNSGNYEPGNCRWATMKEQRANQRPYIAFKKKVA